MKFGIKRISRYRGPITGHTFITRSTLGFISKFQGLVNPKTKGFRVGPLLFWWKKK